jgi:hypothetical protein
MAGPQSTYRAVSGVFRTIDPPPPLHPASMSSPRTKGGGGGVHTRRAVRGQYFGRKTPDIGLASYSIIPLRAGQYLSSVQKNWRRNLCGQRRRVSPCPLYLPFSIRSFNRQALIHQHYYCKNSNTIAILHRKKSFSIIPSLAGMSLTKLSLGENNLYMTSLFPIRYSRPQPRCHVPNSP